MLVIAIGDYIGSSYEGKMFKRSFRFTKRPFLLSIDDIPKESRFTDDTYLSFALIESMLTEKPFYLCLKKWAGYYPNASYGKYFMDWVKSNKKSYRSYGNGAAVRAVLIGLINWKSDKDIKNEVNKYTLPTHGHPEGMKAAQTTAMYAAIYRRYMSNGHYGSHEAQIARNIGSEKLFEILKKEYLTFVKVDNFFDLPTAKQLSKKGVPSAKAVPTIPNVLITMTDRPAFFEDSILDALYLNEDSDTQAAIACGIMLNSVSSTDEMVYNEFLYPLFDFILDKFDSRMLYWYEKFQKNYNLN